MTSFWIRARKSVTNSYGQIKFIAVEIGLWTYFNWLIHIALWHFSGITFPDYQQNLETVPKWFSFKNAHYGFEWFFIILIDPRLRVQMKTFINRYRNKVHKEPSHRSTCIQRKNQQVDKIVSFPLSNVLNTIHPMNLTYHSPNMSNKK